MQRGCELCEGVAALYCAADKAHICWTCDAKVHSANFLVARHTRSVLCTTCATPTLWRTSGANPTPPLLTGPQLCANCSSQGESQGECTTRENNNNNEDPTIVNSNNRIATAVSISSGCSTSNNPAGGSSSGFAAVRDSPCTQTPTPQLTSSDSSSSTTASTTTTTTSIVTVDSVSSRISACHPKRLAPGGVVQIATRALQDVNRGVSRGQCDCREEEESHEPIYGERRGCSGRSESVKESMRPAGAMAMAVQQVPVASTSRVMRTLAKWHWDLHLSSPGTVPLALRMFRKVSRALAPAVLSNAGLRVTLAACLRLAAGLDEAQVVVPKASEVAACAGVSMRRLAMTEIHLLALLGWRRFPIWAGVRS